MKNLYILRHAKADTPNYSVNDINRPLIDKGVLAATDVSIFLKNNNHSIDLIVSSTAKRALDTAKIVAKNIDYHINNIKVDNKLYMADPEDILSILDMVFINDPTLSNDKVNSIMIVGHNPALTYFANYFLTDKVDNLPTAGLVGLQFNSDTWNNLSKAKVTEILRLTPKQLKNNT